jgi:hypothetical protein
MAILPGAITGAPNGFNNTPNAAASVANNVASNVSGVFSTKPSAKYMSGARCALKINSSIVGFAFGISWDIRTSAREINTIDNNLPYELVPQRITVEGTISALHIPGISEVRDSKTNQLLFATDRAMIIERTEDIKVDQLSSVTLRFRAIGFQDEKPPATPNNFDQDSSAATTNTRVQPSLTTTPIVTNLAGGANVGNLA